MSSDDSIDLQNILPDLDEQQHPHLLVSGKHRWNCPTQFGACDDMDNASTLDSEMPHGGTGADRLETLEVARQ